MVSLCTVGVMVRVTTGSMSGRTLPSNSKSTIWMFAMEQQLPVLLITVSTVIIHVFNLNQTIVTHPVWLNDWAMTDQSTVKCMVSVSTVFLSMVLISPVEHRLYLAGRRETTEATHRRVVHMAQDLVC